MVDSLSFEFLASDRISSWEKSFSIGAPPQCLSCSHTTSPVGSIQGEDYVDTVTKLENFSSLLIYKADLQAIEERIGGGESETDDSLCCICYAKEADARFVPCSHVSCYGCISRNLLNCPRCFFCNATVVDVKQDAKPI